MSNENRPIVGDAQGSEGTSAASSDARAREQRAEAVTTAMAEAGMRESAERTATIVADALRRFEEDRKREKKEKKEALKRLEQEARQRAIDEAEKARAAHAEQLPVLVKSASVKKAHDGLRP
jgi:hypothetical protein